jgi:hypothetical protein
VRISAGRYSSAARSDVPRRSSTLKDDCAQAIQAAGFKDESSKQNVILIRHKAVATTATVCICAALTGEDRQDVALQPTTSSTFSRIRT